MVRDPEVYFTTQVKRCLDIAWRRKWTIIVAAVLSAGTSAALVAITPRVYRARTIVLVTRQTVPETMVRSAVALRIEECLKNLRIQIFSRSYLEQIVHEFGLASPTASEAELEAACSTLRERITAELDRRDFSWFRISVNDADPKRAAGIANRLAALFIEQNSRMRADQAAGTLQLTGSWVERYRLELGKRDEAISEFNRANMYELPEQQSTDVQLLSSAQLRISQLTSDIRTRTDRLQDLRAQRQAMWAIDERDGNGDEPLASMQRELAELRLRYTDDNPLVIRERERVAALVRPFPPPGLPGALSSPSANAGLGPLSLQIDALEDEVKALEAERARETSNVATSEARIADSPRLQQELGQLTRGYEQVKQRFDNAVAQNEEAQRSQGLEASNQGDQFRVQDIAYPPAIPWRPDMVRVLAFGMALGLAIGAGVIAFRELFVQTVWGEQELAADFPDLPLYGVIPSLAVAHSSRTEHRV